MNTQYVNLIYKLNQTLLWKVTDNLLSISFSYEGEKIKIVQYFLEGTLNEKNNNFILEFKQDVNNKLKGYNIEIKVKEISKKQFNPGNFEREKYRLFERSEI